MWIYQASKPNKHAVLRKASSALCIVCFLLPSCFTCNGMLNCSCYCCCNCCCYPSYCIVSLFASYLDFLSIAPARYISFSFVACSLNALSSSHSLHPHFSISLRSLLSFWDESHPKLFPNLSSSGDLYASCELKDHSKSIISLDHVSSYQSVNHQSPLTLEIEM